MQVVLNVKGSFRTAGSDYNREQPNCTRAPQLCIVESVYS